MSGDEPLEDPITAAILRGTHYERLRVSQRGLFKQPLARKLAWQSAILAGLALVLPLTMQLPESTRELFSSSDLLWSSPKILLLCAFAGFVVSTAALGLVYVGYRRLQSDGELSEREARRLLTIEDVASVMSFITGAFAVIAVDGYILLGYGGEAMMAAYFDAGGENLFAAAQIPVTVLELAVASGLLAVVFFVLSRLFNRKLSN